MHNSKIRIWDSQYCPVGTYWNAPLMRLRTGVLSFLIDVKREKLRFLIFLHNNMKNKILI